MKSVKLAVIAALSSFAVSAFALAPMQDSDLSAVSGQDGVSIAADLQVRVGAFTYTDTGSDALGGGSISFNDIVFRGTIAASIDILSNTNALTDMSTNLGVASAILGAAVHGDVVRIAIPNMKVDDAKNLQFAVKSITMGKSAEYTAVAAAGGGSEGDKVTYTAPTAPSFGSMAAYNIRLQGTTAYIWAH